MISSAILSATLDVPQTLPPLFRTRSRSASRFRFTSTVTKSERYNHVSSFGQVINAAGKNLALPRVVYRSLLRLYARNAPNGIGSIRHFTDNVWLENESIFGTCFFFLFYIPAFHLSLCSRSAKQSVPLANDDRFLASWAPMMEINLRTALLSYYISRCTIVTVED